MITPEQHKEIAAERSTKTETIRKSSPALEDILYTPFPVLDYGFIRVTDYMGNDEAIVQAARMSYGKGTKKVNEDKGLIEYLMRNKHTTPFEMCEIKLHIKLPIFLMRQWIRQRTASVNEYSARYSILDKEFYIPNIEDIKGQSATNKQGSEGEVELDTKEWWIDCLGSDTRTIYGTYEDAMRDGVSREMARIGLSLNTYTQCVWKIDLHNLLNFLEARTHSHAQMEIQKYANVILDFVKMWVPLTYEAFKKYRLNSITLCESAVESIKEALADTKVNLADYSIPRDEKERMIKAFDLNHDD